MDYDYLNQLQNSDTYSGSSFVTQLSILWQTTKVGKYVCRVLPADPIKCPKGLGFLPVHWGYWKGGDKKSTIQCNRHYGDKCWSCDLGEHFSRLPTQNDQTKKFVNEFRPTPTLFIPTYLPPVVQIDMHNNILFGFEQESTPNVVIWQVSPWYLRENLLLAFRSNELLTHPQQGRYIVWEITPSKGVKKYPAVHYFPVSGGMTIHPDPAKQHAILTEYYPNVEESMNNIPRKTPQEMQQFLMSRADLLPYLNK